MTRSAHLPKVRRLLPLAAALFVMGCGGSDIGEDASDVTDHHEHKEVSYEKILRPVVENMAKNGAFGEGIKTGFDAVTEFARTDFAHNACLDTPDAWGLEISAGGNIGVGYFQGIEMALEGGNIHLNCLNQLQLSPEFSVGTRVNLIRHLGECEAEGESLEDTLFVEIGAGLHTSLGLDLQVGIAYTAGLRKGLLNRTLPDFFVNSFKNWAGIVDAVTSGEPVFGELEDPEEHKALCEAANDLFDDKANAYKAKRVAHAQKMNAFLKDYLEENTHCEGAIGDVVVHDDHDDEHGDEHDDHDEHDEADLHDFTVCTDLTIKNAIGFMRERIQTQRDATTGVAYKALGQLDITVALLDDMFSGCDHIEFQFGAGIGVATPVTVSLALESHNNYGTLAFDGTEDELGAVLAEIISPETFDKDEKGGFVSWLMRKTCAAIDLMPDWGIFENLEGDAACHMADTSRSTLGFVETLRADPRFTAEFATSLDLWGLSLPLPDDPLLNYAVNCSLGPVRNTLELLWYEP